MVLKKTFSTSSPHPHSRSQHPQRACHGLALCLCNYLRPLGTEGGHWRGSSYKGNPVCPKDQCSLGRRSLFPMVVPCLEITCTMSHSHLFVCFPKRYCLFLKRKEGASEVQFCSNSGETAESTCFSFATHSRHFPQAQARGSGRQEKEALRAS